VPERLATRVLLVGNNSGDADLVHPPARQLDGMDLTNTGRRLNLLLVEDTPGDVNLRPRRSQALVTASCAWTRCR
jgi:hypothetical protein